MSALTIGIDIGTTGTKTVLFDTDLGIVAQASRETTLHSPGPGLAEADTGQWHRNVTESIREILHSSGIRGGSPGFAGVSAIPEPKRRRRWDLRKGREPLGRLQVPRLRRRVCGRLV